MFNIITVVLDLIIAAVGLYFTVCNVRDEKRKREKEEIEKKHCLQLAGQSGEIDNLIKDILDTISSLDKNIDKIAKRERKAAVRGNKDLFALVTDLSGSCSCIYEKGYKIKEQVYEIYKDLVKHESMFSLSLGFERIINVCRNMIYDMDDVLNDMNDGYRTFHGIAFAAGMYQNGQITDEQIDKWIECSKSIQNDLKRMSDMLTNCNRYIKELEIKFSD